MVKKKDTYENYVKPHLANITKWRKMGMGFSEMAKKLGIHRSTLSKLRSEHEELQNAILEGEQEINDRIEKSLYDSLENKYIFEEDIEYEFDEVTGEEIPVSKKVKKRFVPVNPTLLIFALKNRMPNEWNDKAELTKAQIEKLREGTNGEGGGVEVTIIDDVPLPGE